MFRDELEKCEGNITVWINSPGGDVFAAAQIYNMLMNYKVNVNVRIDGLAASAASVIAMAGTTVEMSPVGIFMIHMFYYHLPRSLQEENWLARPAA